MSNTPFTPSQSFSDALGEVRAAVVAEGKLAGLPGLVQQAILALLEMLAAFVAALKEGTLAIPGPMAASEAPAGAGMEHASETSGTAGEGPARRGSEPRRPARAIPCTVSPSRPDSACPVEGTAAIAIQSSASPTRSAARKHPARLRHSANPRPEPAAISLVRAVRFGMFSKTEASARAPLRVQIVTISK